MGRYLGKRLASTIPLLLVISFVVFMFIHMIPGDPARLVAGQDATKEDVAVVREQLGLDEPLLVQYGKYMKGLFTGDLGSSIKTVNRSRDNRTKTETNYHADILIHDMGCNHRYCNRYHRCRISWQNS